MPVIPMFQERNDVGGARFTASAAPVPERYAPPALRVSASDFQGVGDQLAEFASNAAGLAAKVTEHFWRAKNITEAGNIQVENLREIGEFIDGLHKRQDFDRFEPELEEIQKKQTERIGQRIDNREIQERVANSAFRDFVGYRTQVRALARARQIDTGLASYEKNMFDLEGQLSQVEDPELRAPIVQKAQDLIIENQQAGYISKSRAEKEFHTFAKKENLVQAMRSLRDNPEGFDPSSYPLLDEQTRILLSDQAGRRAEENRRRLEREQQQALQEKRKGVMRLIADDERSILLTGVPLDGIVGQAQEALSETEFQDFLKNRGRAAGMHSAFEEIRYAPPDRAEKILAKFKPQPGEVGFKDRQEDFDTLENTYRSAMKIFQDDPASYVSKNPAVKTLNDRLSVQESMGLPSYLQRVTTKAETKGHLGKIESLKPEEQARYLDGLSKSFGGNWSMAWRELVKDGLPTESQVAASVVNDPVTLRDVSNAVTAGRKEIEKRISDHGLIKAVKEGVSSELSDFRETVMRAGATSSSVKTLNDVEDVIQQTALFKVSQGVNQKKAVSDAVNRIILDKYYPIGGGGWFGKDILRYARVPKGVPYDSVVDQASAFLDNLESVDLDLPEKNRKDYLRMIKGEAYWSTLADDTGLILMMNGIPVMQRNGAPVSFDFPGLRYKIVR